MDLPFTLAEPKALILLLTIPPVILLGLLSARARPRDRARINTSTVVRSVILLLIILALAGLQFISSGGPLTVVFLIDESASVSQTSRDAAVGYVQKAIAQMGADDRAGVVLFGERAIVDRAVSTGADWQPFGKNPSVVATNIADAIQVGSALFPEGGSRRLVLLSDGAQTVGSAVDVARRVGATGIQLSVVPLGAQAQNEVAVDQVASPNSVPAGERFDVRVLLKSTSDRAATVSLFEDSAPVGKQETQLKQGDNVVTFSVIGKQGFHVFKAHVASVDDRYSENNDASSYTIVSKPPSVLIVAGTPADAAPLNAALVAGGMEVRIVTPDGVPQNMDNLTKYDAVVLANAPSEAIGNDAQLALQSYVRDTGRGLIMLGGDLSYGAGGYLRTPMEEVLPVSMDVRTSEQRASLATAFVIDKSGSMGRCHASGAQQFNPSMRTEFGPSKVEIAKQAVEKAAALLNSTDKVGVIAFDQSPAWLVNLESMGQIGEQNIASSLKPVQAEGATNIYSGLQSAIDALSKTDAKLKHIVFISDGWSQQTDFTALLNQLATDNITLSSVAAGEGAGSLMQDLAQKGGGQYYAAPDINSLPSILLKDTISLIGSYYVEKPFKPIVNNQSPILKGLDAQALPQLLGYDAATLKPNADLVLKSPNGDPILAQWQYGLGRTVAWTPDVKGRWATSWVTWPQFSQFAAQMVSWVMPQDASPGIQTTFTVAPATAGVGTDVAVRIESVDTTGAPRNLLRTTVTISGTGQPAVEVPIFQSSPGVYTGLARGLKEGVYSAQVNQYDQASGKSVGTQQTGLVVPYPSEYRLSTSSAAAAAALLGDLAQVGGGKRLDIAQPAAAFSHDIRSQPRPIPLWPWLLGLAVLLFPVDVAVRRLTISRSELRHALHRYFIRR